MSKPVIVSELLLSRLFKQNSQEKLTAAEQLALRCQKDAARLPTTIDQASLIAYWRHLKDPMSFNNLLKQHQVSRLQAIQMVGSEFAHPIVPSEFSWAMQQVEQDQITVQVSSYHNGGHLNYQGSIRYINQSLYTQQLSAESYLPALTWQSEQTFWVVHKPGYLGLHSSLECFSEQGELLLTVSNSSQTDLATSLEWYSLLGKLQGTPAEVAA